jgi:peptidoglycan/xylan/chitin deacetylase (PgdA/CDA1 family)
MIISLGIKPLISLSKQRIFLPFYHSVSDDPPKHLRYLYEVRNIKHFSTDLDFLLKYFKPVGLKELIDVYRNQSVPANPLCHLTFDDGLSEFNDIIVPILLSKGIPSSCFLNSAFIDNKDLFYRYKASLLIETLHSSLAGSLVWKGFHEFSAENNIPNKYYRKLLLSMDYNKKDLLDKLAIKIGVNFRDYLSDQKPYLTTEQIRHLIQKGFTFGAHSIDHPDYRFLTEEEQIRQTKESIDCITTLFGLDYKAFSFPFTDFGVKKSFFDKVFDERIADITFGCAGIKTDSVSVHLQRLPVESYKSNLKETFKEETSYYIFSKMFKKNLIRRT